MSVYSTMDAAMDAAFTFSLTTTSCPHKVNKFCTSDVCLFNIGCCSHVSLTTTSCPTRSISSAPLMHVYSTLDAAVDAAITFSLTTTSSPYKVNKFCTSVVCLFNNRCCNGCYYQFFIESSASVDNDIHFVMISDILIESSAPVWMINNHIHPVTISYLLIESSAPVWIIDNDIHLVMILDAFIESSVCMIVNDIQLVMI